MLGLLDSKSEVWPQGLEASVTPKLNVWDILFFFFTFGDPSVEYNKEVGNKGK